MMRKKRLQQRNRDLIKTARDLVHSSNNRPRQSNLLRAVSTSYYALFHTLARCCADTVIGGSGSQRSLLAWAQVYRALEHRFCKNACKNSKVSQFHQDVQDFANMFVTMQDKRHSADYDPKTKASKSVVLSDIDLSEAAIVKFEKVSIEQRRAFAALVLFKQR